MHPLLFQYGHLVDDLAKSTWAGSVLTHIISEKLMYTWFFQPIDLVSHFTELTRLNLKTHVVFQHWSYLLFYHLPLEIMYESIKIQRSCIFIKVHVLLCHALYFPWSVNQLDYI